MRFGSLLASALFVAAGLVAAPAAAEPVTTGAPDLSGYREVPADGFVDSLVAQGEVYFQTPDGLLCAIRPAHGAAGCDGRLPNTRAGVNEIVLAADVADRGLRATANPQFVKPSGSAARVLPVGSKIVYQDFVCAVGEGSTTLCTKSSGDQLQWLEISSTGTGVGPATAGLPDGFPDPNDFVVGDDNYIVGAGAKNIFPVFTVDAGLTCTIAMFSGGEVGCNGNLPGASGAENEVFAQFPGPVGIRKTDDPKFDKPAYPGTVRQLPVGYRVSEMGATCMAIEGGVACYGTLAGQTQGFEVSAEGVTTFGGAPQEVSSADPDGAASESTAPSTVPPSTTSVPTTSGPTASSVPPVG
ncbi:hypothetical protein BVC93_05815 [Mycobacterium sp. MS1601]|uniref:hypothetical protein n=1 Tax=Mycobacterium sp. MS1601 TaxID=1936029 RepID=UPI00097966C0|nr:hypothetical protein [Mycobacterium sp. MS1601]AQA02026.1 hypothetical protein BVC93_05815 [Mycobacterium sp. MS1601]